MENTSLTQPTQISAKSNCKREKCNECNKRRNFLEENHQICHVCYKAKSIIKLSGDKIIDDFIRYTQINHVESNGKMEFVPYDQFKNIELIAEGGTSKIYKAIWVNGPITNYDMLIRESNYRVVLKKLDNSKNVTNKELNELKIFYDFSLRSKSNDNVNEYFGITQDPITQDIIIIMPYYESGDLTHYINNDFYNISWERKLSDLKQIINGLRNIHNANIIHRDFNSGSIYFSGTNVVIGDLGASKSATGDDNNENYGVIPYIAPEIFQGQKYTKASDIYSFGMIMWEFMTGRRPFWDKTHDVNLVIEICDGLRPPIVTNAPEGYIELMKECWNSEPRNRPAARDIHRKITYMHDNEDFQNPTKIIESSDIGPVTTNNPGAIYESRPLSDMIQSIMSPRSSRSHSIDLETDSYQENNMASIDKRKFEDDLIEDDNDNGQSIKRSKLSENENDENITEEIDPDK